MISNPAQSAWQAVLRGLSAIAAVVLAGAVPAQATGNLGCATDDAAMDLNIESVITHGLGEPIVSLRGEIVLKDKAAASHFGSIAFDKAHLAQYWLEGKDLRLLVYVDLDSAKAQGSIELVIKTEAMDDEGGFAGRYGLDLSYSVSGETGEGHTLKTDGAVECFAG